jgi:prenylcysteine oxidase/farnesylcysteine lyase
VSCCLKLFRGSDADLICSTRVNYASNLGYIHGLETMVCMATNGAVQVEGGNWQIFANMLNASSATVRLNTAVSKISKQPDSTYQLTLHDGETTTFDEIILAAPLQYTNLAIDPPPTHVPDEIPYMALHVTLFASPFLLSPAAFNLAPATRVPQFVLTTFPPASPPADSAGPPGFYSISLHNTGVNTHANPPRLEYVYKIFSPEPVNATFLSHILGQSVSDDADVNGTVSWVHRKLWHSYPREFPRVTFEELSLEEGMWYTSGIEGFISTMETSALSGKNVARLVRDGWMGTKEKEKEEGEGESVLEKVFGGEEAELWEEEL